MSLTKMAGILERLLPPADPETGMMSIEISRHRVFDDKNPDQGVFYCWRAHHQERDFFDGDLVLEFISEDRTLEGLILGLPAMRATALQAAGRSQQGLSHG